MSANDVISKLPHHEQQKLCQTRPPYRQGKKLTAVKVYTVNDESQHLMICGVPQLKLNDEVKKLVCSYGDVKKICVAPEYPTEKFTEAFHIHYAHISSARLAKRFLDGKNFYGGILHVFYVPELESVLETKAKLMQRCKDVSVRLKCNQKNSTNSKTSRELYYDNESSFFVPSTEGQFVQNNLATNEQSHCANDYANFCETGLELSSTESQSTRRTTNTFQESKTSNFKRNKRKNYKGQSIKDGVKVKIIRPEIITNKSIVNVNTTTVKTVKNSVRKPRNNIVLKLPPDINAKKKKIVLKNPSVTNLIEPSQNLQDKIQIVKKQVRAALQKFDSSSSTNV